MGMKETNFNILLEEKKKIKESFYCNIICSNSFQLDKESFDFISNSSCNIAIGNALLITEPKYLVLENVFSFENLIGTEHWYNKEFPFIVQPMFNKETVKHEKSKNSMEQKYNSFITNAGINSIGNKYTYFYSNHPNIFSFEQNTENLMIGNSPLFFAMNFAHYLGYTKVLIWGAKELPLYHPLRIYDNYSYMLEEANKMFGYVRELNKVGTIKTNFWNMESNSKLNIEHITLKTFKNLFAKDLMQERLVKEEKIKQSNIEEQVFIENLKNLKHTLKLLEDNRLLEEQNFLFLKKKFLVETQEIKESKLEIENLLKEIRSKQLSLEEKKILKEKKLLEDLRIKENKEINQLTSNIDLENKNISELKTLKEVETEKLNMLASKIENIQVSESKLDLFFLKFETNYSMFLEEIRKQKDKEYCNIICGGQSIDDITEEQHEFINNSTNICINKSFLKFKCDYIVYAENALFDDFIGVDKWMTEKYPVLVRPYFTKDVIDALYNKITPKEQDRLILQAKLNKFLDIAGKNGIGNKIIFFNYIKNFEEFQFDYRKMNIMRGWSSTNTALNLAYFLGFKKVYVWGLDGHGSHYKNYYCIDGKIPREQGKTEWGYNEPREIPDINFRINLKNYEYIAGLIKSGKLNMEIINMSKISSINCFKRGENVPV